MTTVTDIKQHVDNIDNLLSKLQDVEKVLRVSELPSMLIRTREYIKMIKDDRKYLQRFLWLHYQVRV